MKALGWAIIAVIGIILGMVWAVQISVPGGYPPRWLVPMLLVILAIGIILVRAGG